MYGILSVYIPCAIGIMVNDENNGRERGKKEEQHARLTTHDSFSILHLIGYPSDSWFLCGLLTTRFLKPKYRVDVWRPTPGFWPNDLSNKAVGQTVFYTRDWWPVVLFMHHSNVAKCSDNPAQLFLTCHWAYRPPRSPPVVGVKSEFSHLPWIKY